MNERERVEGPLPVLPLHCVDTAIIIVIIGTYAVHTGVSEYTILTNKKVSCCQTYVLMEKQK